MYLIENFKEINVLEHFENLNKSRAKKIKEFIHIY